MNDALRFDCAEGAVLPAFLVVIFQHQTADLKTPVDVPDVPGPARTRLRAGA
jgi:hypothetical protein